MFLGKFFGSTIASLLFYVNSYTSTEILSNAIPPHHSKVKSSSSAGWRGKFHKSNDMRKQIFICDIFSRRQSLH